MGLSGSSLSFAMIPSMGQVDLPTHFLVLLQPSSPGPRCCGKKFGIGGHRLGGVCPGATSQAPSWTVLLLEVISVQGWTEDFRLFK